MSEVTIEETYELYQDYLNNLANKELDEKETFSESMVDHIKDVYKNLNEKRKQWLKDKEKEES